jgi:coenzyme PQQ precursor peptide PqqA
MSGRSTGRYADRSGFDFARCTGTRGNQGWRSGLRRLVPGLTSGLAFNGKDDAMTWETPTLVEMRVGMEVTSYESAEIDGPEGDVID